MKLSTKITRACLCLSLVLTMLATSAFAAEPAGDGNAGGTPVPTGQTMEVPVSQTEANINGRQVLTKVFEVSPDVNPESLKEYGLVIGGYEYTLSSFTKETATKEDTKSVTKEHEIALTSSNKNDAYVEALKTFPQTLKYDEEGYAGELNLVASTIEVEETGRSQKKASDVKTKTYTFDYNDDSLVPPTIPVGGATYKRSSVSWSDGAYGPNGVMPENYVATARYYRSWSYSSVDGYKAVASYTGDATLSDSELIKYTVEYIGTPIASAANDGGFLGNLFGGKTSSQAPAAMGASQAAQGGSSSGGFAMAALIIVLLFLAAMTVVLTAQGKIKFDFASAKSGKNTQVSAETRSSSSDVPAGPEGANG